MQFREILTHWYSVHKRNLPWRETTDPYHIWLSEIILQQTQVNQGLPYYEEFTTQFPTIFDLARASEHIVLMYWQGLGYYSRARNLHKTARQIVEHHQGKFPETYSELIKFKGIGDYTASAIASICFDEKCAVVDGNVYRVLSRYFGIETPINSSKGITEFKSLAQKLLPEEQIGIYNQAIMEFGSKQCMPKSPDCTSCVLSSSCMALKLNMVNIYPVKINKQKVKKRYFNYLVFISKDGKTLLKQRKGKGIWQNLYEFPLIETDNTLTLSLFSKNENIRSVLNDKEYKINLFNDNEIVHKLSHQHLYTQFWIIEVDSLQEDGILISHIEDYPVPVLIKNFIEGFDFS